MLPFCELSVLGFFSLKAQLGGRFFLPWLVQFNKDSNSFIRSLSSIVWDSKASIRASYLCFEILKLQYEHL